MPDPHEQLRSLIVRHACKVTERHGSKRHLLLNFRQMRPKLIQRLEHDSVRRCVEAELLWPLAMTRHTSLRHDGLDLREIGRDTRTISRTAIPANATARHRHLRRRQRHNQPREGAYTQCSRYHRPRPTPPLGLLARDKP